jgi:hypothetical protein
VEDKDDEIGRMDHHSLGTFGYILGAMFRFGGEMFERRASQSGLGK